MHDGVCPQEGIHRLRSPMYMTQFHELSRRSIYGYIYVRHIYTNIMNIIFVILGEFDSLDWWHLHVLDWLGISVFGMLFLGRWLAMSALAIMTLAWYGGTFQGSIYHDGLECG